MNNTFIGYVKKHLYISLILSFAVSLIYYFYTKGAGTGYEHGLIKESVALFFCSFGVFSLGFIVVGIMFPKKVIKNYVGEPDQNNNVTVYYYDKYVGDICKVVRMYGDPSVPETMQVMYSFLDATGNYITKEWFFGVGDFKDNRCVVSVGDYEYNIIDEKGNMLCPKNYAGMTVEINDNKVKVSDGNGNVNFVDVRTGNEVWPEWKREALNYD